jgi:hypothetical protein
VLLLLVIFLIVLVWYWTEKMSVEKEDEVFVQHFKTKNIEMSILRQVHEYQYKLIMYRKLYHAYNEVEDPQLRDANHEKVRKKLNGFVFKLQEGNKFDMEGEEELDEERTKFINILMDKAVSEVNFRIINIEYNYYDVSDKDNEYLIDCTAKVTMSFLHASSPVKNQTVTMEVDHMKICEPD